MIHRFFSTLFLTLLLSSSVAMSQTNRSMTLIKDAPPTYVAPEWAKKVVWYQIFPERFRNGDPSNDPTLATLKGAWPHDHTSPWQVHPWTSDWYELQPYEQKNGKDIWFNIQRRRYGGDLQGVLDKLDYLQELGVGAIYFNPVFEAPSMHKYDGATYHHIDPNFGPDPDGDRRLIATETPDDPSTWVWTEADKLMLTLIDELHQRGMYVIFDGVFNHMGINSWPFQDVKAKQQASKFRDWFEITSWDDPQTGETFDYKGWFGVRELPELREDENGIVAGPRDYIYAITRRWMDPNNDGNPDDGIDGWRLDVAYCVAHPFWKEWRQHVKAINPQAYLTAEVIDSNEVLAEYLQGDEFDAVMNYNFAFTCAEYFIADSGAIATSEFDSKLRELRQAFHPEMAYVMQNLFGSHDTNRLASHIVNRGLGSYRDWGTYFGLSKGGNPDYDPRKPTTAERDIQKLFAIFQMTYVGAPMIYYGDEVGMWGANDPCCRKPMVWDDLTYDPEVCHPDGSKRSPDTVQVEHDLLEHYRRLIHIRNDYPALQIGNFRTLITDDARGLYAFSRSYREQTVIVVLNNSPKPQTLNLELPDGIGLRDVLNDRQYRATDGTLQTEIEPRWGVVLVNE